MIAIEIFFFLVLVGLGVVLLLQHFIRRDNRGHKGDAEKTPEEIRSHQSGG
jgi:hypothetical protein